MTETRPHHCRRRRGPATPGGEDGFTLVELMVVIAILALLAGIVAFNVIPIGERAKTQKAQFDIKTIEGALEMYKLQNGEFPTTSQGLQALVTLPQGANPATYQSGGYIKGGKLPADPWGRPYLYQAPGRHGDADVWTLGRDGKDGGEGADADVGSWQ